MDQDVLGTPIRPTRLSRAASQHGRHMARYMLARRYAKGKRCLDIACGSGFGSAYLAEVAESVVGMDLDPEMIKFADRYYARQNVEFRQGDLHESIADGPFDLVTSFETLEHVRDSVRCLEVLAASLTSNGIAVISVPNGAKEQRRAGGKSYHQKQFTADEFEALLVQRFARVDLYSQFYHRGLRHYVRRLLGRRSHHASSYRFVYGLSDEAKTWLAICKHPRTTRPNDS